MSSNHKNNESTSMKVLTKIHRYVREIYKGLSLIEIWPLFLLLILFFPLIGTLIPWLGLDISNIYIILFVLIFIITLLLILINKNKKYIKTALSGDYIIKLLFIFSMVGFVATANSSFSLLKDLKAPILHDPMDHAMMAKSILTTNQISFFYSPLLHSASAVFSIDSVMRIPWLITFFTQLAVLLIPLQFSLLFHYFNKSIKYSIVLYLLLSTLHFPAIFYYIAGKNSLILALSLIPTTIYLVDNYNKNRNPINAIKLTVVLFLLFMAHYPTFGIFFFLCTPWFIFIIFEHLKAKSVKSILKFATPYIISAVLSVIWFAPRYYQATDLLSESVVTPDAKELVLNKQILINGFVNSFNDYFMRFFQTWHIVFLIPMFLKKTHLVIKLTVLWIYVSLTISYFLVNTFNQSTLLGMVPNTLELIFPNLLIFILVFIIAFVFLLNKIPKTSLFFLCFVLISLTIYSQNKLNETVLMKHNQLNVISEDDLKAFEFIETELPQNITFLNGGQEATNKNGAIYPVDGAMWLPLYTNNKVFIDFQNFSSYQTNYNNQLFQKIILGDDDRPEIEEIKDMGIEYGYIDQGVFGESLSEEILHNVSYSVLFESGPVKIIQFD